jgi:hypothetical protein
MSTSPDDVIGGYAHGTLTPDERRTLFERVLHDDEMFETLVAEEPLRELLDDQAFRQSLRRELAAEAKSSAWLSWLSWRVITSVGLGAAAALTFLLTFLPPEPASIRTEPPMNRQQSPAPQSATTLPVPPPQIEELRPPLTPPPSTSATATEAIPPNSRLNAVPEPNGISHVSAQPSVSTGSTTGVPLAPPVTPPPVSAVGAADGVIAPPQPPAQPTIDFDAERASIRLLLDQWTAAYNGMDEGRLRQIDPAFKGIPGKLILRSVEVRVSNEQIEIAADGLTATLQATQTFNYWWERSGMAPTSTGVLRWTLRKSGNTWTVSQ